MIAGGRWIVVVVAGLALVFAAPAAAAPFTTLQRTMLDCDGDDRLEPAPGEDYVAPGSGDDEDECAPREGTRPRLANPHSILHFVHLTDFQMVDEESPARVEFFDSSQRGPFNPFSAAYRPQESLTTQVTEAMARQVRESVSPVTGERPALSILTGDNADSQQLNETRWFIDVLDGRRRVDPNSGVPVPGCEATPGSVYDGVRDGGRPGQPDDGYYEPDESETDGDGYTPDRAVNFAETGRAVTVRDFPQLFEAANTPFEATGVDMPWYSAFGNHDALVQGNSPDAYFGPGGPTNPAPPAQESVNPIMHSIATGCVKPSNAQAQAVVDDYAQHARVLSAGGLGAGSPAMDALVADFEHAMEEQVEQGNAVVVPPDARRCHLAKDEPVAGGPGPCAATSFIDQHFATTGTPVGHGFANRPPQARVNHDGYYSFKPRPGLRFVVLDTVTDECGSQFCFEGSVDDVQFRWLEDELSAAASAGEYVLTFSHHTLRTTRQPTTDVTEQPIHYGRRGDRENPLNPQNVSVGRSLEELYCEHPNVLAHVSGHEHQNYVEHHDCSFEQAGPGDFWEVSTAAHLDWPQQARLLELVSDGGQMSLVLTIVDHTGPANPGGAPALCPGRRPAGGCGNAGEQVVRLAGIARELAYNDYQGGRFGGARGERDDRNLIVPLGRPWPAR